MTDRDRLIEFIKYAHGICRDENCEVCQLKKEYGTCRMIAIADHLLANGIIVPPCKVGDKVYQTDGIRIYESEVIEIYQDRIAKIIYNTNGIAFDERAIGTSVFLTKEEAEAELRKRGVSNAENN